MSTGDTFQLEDMRTILNSFTHLELACNQALAEQFHPKGLISTTASSSTCLWNFPQSRRWITRSSTSSVGPTWYFEQILSKYADLSISARNINGKRLIFIGHFLSAKYYATAVGIIAMLYRNRGSGKISSVPQGTQEDVELQFRFMTVWSLSSQAVS